MDAPSLNIPSPKSLRIANSVFFFISGFGYSSWAARIPSIQQQLHLNEAQLGALLFAAPIGVMLTLPITSRLLGVFNSKQVMLYGVLSFNIILSIIGFATQSWELAIVLFIFGCSRNLLNLSMNAQAVGVQAIYGRSIMTSFHGIWSLAGFAGAAFGYLMVSKNIAVSYHLLATGIALTILGVYFYPNALNQPAIKQEKKTIYHLPDKFLLKFALICFASMACENTMYDWSEIYFQKVVHGSKSAATAAFVVYMIAMTTGRFTGDKIVQSFGVKKLLNVSGALIFCGLSLAVFLPNPFITNIGFAMVGFGVSCIVPLVFATAGKSKTMSSGVALASISTIGTLGFLMVPPLVGFVAQEAGLQWSFGIISLMGILIIIMVRKIKDED